MSDTPRTDAELPVYHGFPSTVSREFARTLERELSASQAEVERLTATIAAKDEAIKRLNGWLDNDRRALLDNPAEPGA